MKRIVVVTHGYPSAARPNECTFVKELVDMWKNMGVSLIVVKPVTLKEYLKLLVKEKNRDENVTYPLYFDYTILRAFRRFPSVRRFHIKMADRSFQRTVDKTISIQANDILYSHFLDSGFCVAALSEKFKVPAYCAVGESSLWTLEFKDMDEVRRRMRFIRGFIAVSTDNKKMLIKNSIATENKIRVFPNGVNLDTFHKLNKSDCRKELGIQEEKVVGVFLGHFIERKGPLRVAKATLGIDNLSMIYIGTGEQDPQGNNIVYKGPVPHDEIPTYLSAADFFILPTQAEGCCNAIIEAMACGLPIISSNRDFNDDILNDECAIRVDPDNIEEIRAAVKKIVADEKLRKQMEQASLKMVKTLELDKRAKNILNYIGYVYEL